MENSLITFLVAESIKVNVYLFRERLSILFLNSKYMNNKFYYLLKLRGTSSFNRVALKLRGLAEGSQVVDSVRSVKHVN